MAGQQPQSGLSMHSLESIARVAPNMTVADLVAMLHDNDAADDRKDNTSDTEAPGLAKTSATPAAKSLDVSSTAADSSAASVQSAPLTGRPPTDIPETYIQGGSRSVPQGISSFEANHGSTLSAMERSDPPVDSSRQENVQSTSFSQSSTTTLQLGINDENGGIDFSNFVRPAAMTNNLTPAASQPTLINPAPGHSITSGVAISSGVVGRNHATLEICGDKTGKQLLEADSGIDAKQISGARALLVGLAGVPFNKVAGMLNAKREGEQLQDGTLISTRTFDKRVESAIKHIFGVPKGAPYKARRAEYSDAQKDPVLRQKYIEMLKNPSTYQINPYEQCEGCKKKLATQVAAQHPQHGSYVAALGLTPVSNPSMAPNVPNFNAAILDSFSSVPEQSGKVAKTPRRKRKATAFSLHTGEDAAKRWQGESQGPPPQAQSTYGHSFIQYAPAFSQPTYQSEATGRSNFSTFPADEAHLTASLSPLNAEHSDAASRYRNAPQQSSWFPSSPPLVPYTPQYNVESFDSDGDFGLNQFNTAANSDFGFFPSHFNNLSNLNSNVDFGAFTSDALDQDRYFFSEANPTFGIAQQPDLSAFFPQHSEPSSAPRRHDPPADDQGNDGGAQDSSGQGYDQNQ